MAERNDSRRNREQIAEAAAAVFRRIGVDAPLAAVAEAAGVGRATVYRHFPDRATLLSAVLEVRIREVERYAAEYAGDDLLEWLIGELGWYMADVKGLLTALTGPAMPAERYQSVTDRTVTLLRSALGDAKRRGTVRPDVDIGDVLLVTRMVGAVLTTRGLSDDPRDMPRALSICFAGLRNAPARQ